ncbi:MAG TPA: hypothetical protein VFP98_03050 [Candidatus Polarisedimenticolia bacterium]|nr:hypothetical protein [Candidatus Polarisedimenticolia bacterium]
MSRICWIAADLIRETRALGRRHWITLVFAILWPAAMALIDGGSARGMVWPDGMGLRHSIVLNAVGPGSLAMVILIEVFHARRLRRELEPLLAAPVTDIEIVLGTALPSLASVAILALASFPLVRLSTSLGAGRPIGSLAGQLAMHLLASAAGGVWATVILLHAAFRSATESGLAMRAAAGFLLPGLLDTGVAAAGLLGPPRAPAVVLAAGLAAGVAALPVAAFRLKREDLLDPFDP